MDLTARLLRWADIRPLVAEVPGGTWARLAVERLARERGWRVAACPAEANLLVVAGTPHAEVEPYLLRVWQSMTAPRARADVPSGPAAASALDAAVAELHDPARQRDHAASAVHSGLDPEMADRDADRDGLALDQLTVPLGPVLPDWPAGLVVHTVLQGDVIQSARVQLTGLAATRAADEPVPAAAARLDTCARVLSVAGAHDAALAARRLRDEVLTGQAPERRLQRWAAWVRRSRLLRWSLAGIGRVDDADAPPALAGDALARLHRAAEAVSHRHDDPPRHTDAAQWMVEALPRLLEGRELAVARIAVASLDPAVETLAHTEVADG
ncbi:hypothetical protein [Prauserella muralis]|uniref:Uncharacterized protein n=1 Tax=Prauserella muralis TaxID=588067 RepID=A0A2V4AU24_9PSEU|nr:hypothetical protein [Prauserella muralis]PXY19047.1 hypothetical protein BAY60_29985 [Prauserella muralis]TWE28943.1 hypothetical protein FHX69_1612 [Prauserella muralis]